MNNNVLISIGLIQRTDMTELFVIVKYKNMMLDLNLSQFGREKIWGYVNGKD